MLITKGVGQGSEKKQRPPARRSLAKGNATSVLPLAQTNTHGHSGRTRWSAQRPQRMSGEDAYEHPHAKHGCGKIGHQPKVR